MLVYIFETIPFIIKENIIWQDSNEGFKYIINVKSTYIYIYMWVQVAYGVTLKKLHIFYTIDI